MDKKWIGETCDICGKPFTEEDEVVVCPDCGAPYHKACIAQTGHCVHEDWHEQGKNWESTVSEKTEQLSIKCPRCGKINAADSRFCAGCGLPLSNSAGENSMEPPFLRNTPNAEETQNQTYTPNQPFISNQQAFIQMQQIAMSPYAGLNPEEELESGVSVADAAAYIGKNQRYFLPRFKLMKLRTAGLNFAAFIFGGVYYLYRKLYGAGILLLLAQLLLSVPSFIVGVTYAANMMGMSLPFTLNMNVISAVDSVCSILRIVLMFAGGLLFNNLYRKQVYRKVRQVKQRQPEADAARNTLKVKGGVNLPLVLILGVLYVLMNFGLMQLLIQSMNG